MTIISRPVARLSPREARRIMEDKDPGDYLLVDCREAFEFEHGHLPGAHNMPLTLLSGMAREIDRSRTVIVYSSSGARARAAAGMLMRAGFEKVHALAGGMKAWEGVVTHAVPRADITMLTGGENLEQLIALAWILEDGSRRFYAGLSETVQDRYGAWAFRNLADDEAHHKRNLEKLWRSALLSDLPEGFPYDLLDDWEPDLMEGGLKVSDALAWAAEREFREIAEFAVGQEANAYDLYLAIAGQTIDHTAAEVFRDLARHELKHIEHILSLMGT